MKRFLVYLLTIAVVTAQEVRAATTTVAVGATTLSALDVDRGATTAQATYQKLATGGQKRPTAGIAPGYSSGVATWYGTNRGSANLPKTECPGDEITTTGTTTVGWSDEVFEEAYCGGNANAVNAGQPFSLYADAVAPDLTLASPLFTNQAQTIPYQVTVGLGGPYCTCKYVQAPNYTDPTGKNYASQAGSCPLGTTKNTTAVTGVQRKDSAGNVSVSPYTWYACTPASTFTGSDYINGTLTQGQTYTVRGSSYQSGIASTNGFVYYPTNFSYARNASTVGSWTAITGAMRKQYSPGAQFDWTNNAAANIIDIAPTDEQFVEAYSADTFPDIRKWLDNTVITSTALIPTQILAGSKYHCVAKFAQALTYTDPTGKNYASQAGSCPL
jgi:hypothetical protein